LRAQRRLRRVDSHLRGVEIALRQETPGGQLLGSRVFLLRVHELDLAAIQIALGLGQIGLCLREIGARLLKLRVEQRRVSLSR
jgi:hypothetical protein